MCRYAHYIYKEHYACFKCRKMFRQPMRHEMAERIENSVKRIVPCPQCSVSMTNMGKDFKAPRQTEIKQWLKVKQLYANGYAFGSCGCSGPGPRPATLRDVKSFLAEQNRSNIEMVRQQAIQQRADVLRLKRSKLRRLLRDKRMEETIRATDQNRLKVDNLPE